MLQDFYKYLVEVFYVPLYLITWIVALYRYRRYFDTPLKYLPMIIIYTFFTELLGTFIKYSNDFQFFSDIRYSWHNVIIYNLYQLVFFLFFFEVYRKVLKNKKHQKWARYGSYLCSIAYIVNAIIFNPLHNGMSNAHIIGSIILVFLIVIYFKEKKDEGRYPALKDNLMVWVSIALLMFYLPFPLISLSYKIKDLDIGIRAILRPLLLTSIVLMYGTIIFGLIISKRRAFR
ncbi:hypothetical protein SAMN05216294_1595 [Flagellimonas zhangzhouensis]|uniref:Uncharacterized protein n=2 Tax=Flagellimonas zhangzhouensis TaxID=1073328 RepID=A0A1H2QIL1_9FLAO|nr:hypothetical protein SAMN05216294_1595 [Allomuricauda zhangzhouensis]SDW07043.1 hypothetical protein SAMN04487892_0246 [Allomuricauda zhangzhouensis]